MKCDVAIVGAGPYGLSVAAHLSAQNVSFRVFGPPMDTWRNAMPAGMFLKSEGFASSLSDPGNAFSLAHYSTANGIPYADTGLPVPLKTFTDYCMAFQQRFAPNHDARSVTRIERDEDGFWLTLDDGELVFASRVVIAVGITHYAHMPHEFAGLPEAFVAHSSQHPRPWQVQAARRSSLIGAGASAMDIGDPAGRGGGIGGTGRAQSQYPFPQPADRQAARILGKPEGADVGPGAGLALQALHRPAPSVPRSAGKAAAQDRRPSSRPRARAGGRARPVEGRVPFHLGAKLRRVAPKGDKIALEIETQSGDRTMLGCDHIIAATGYVVDLRRLPFMTAPLLSDIKTAAEHSPVLSANFESTVPGLYFVGVSASASFGPMMRFAYGAAYTARRLSRHLVRKSQARSLCIPGPAPERSAPSSA